MTLDLVLGGDVNLRGLQDPAVPFSALAPRLRAADLVFVNLECCLYDAPGGEPRHHPAFYAPASAGGEALAHGGVHAVGLANNVNFGDAAIAASIRRLDELGIAHTGAGANLAQARAPVVLERKGLRVGFLQRTSVYWAAGHEAKEDMPGVAVIRGHTAYELPMHRDVQPLNRPGVPPIIRTWANADSLNCFRDDCRALREQADIVVASFHWGTGADVHEYMSEIAHAAVDAGADVVVGHGPHDHCLPIEVYKGRPVFYGLGALSFRIGHVGPTHAGVGLLLQLGFDGRVLRRAAFRFVRQADDMRITTRAVADEPQALEQIRRRSAPYGTKLEAGGEEVAVVLG